MLTREDRLTAEYNKIAKIASPTIHIVDTVGNPPERYELLFTFRSYSRTADKKITLTSKNSIQITLPFGFPQVPPQVKPLTTIFHPNVSEEKIAIEHFWSEKRSLAGLVLHIGKMLRGEIYSKESPLDGDAAEWYHNNRKNLPLSNTVPNEKPTILTRQRKIPHLLKVVIILLALIGIGGGGYILINDVLTIASAKKTFEHFEKQRNAHQYKDAQTTAKESLALLDTIRFLDSYEKISPHYLHFLSSRDLAHGLEGKARFKEKYLPIEKVKKLEVLQPLIEKAQEEADKGKYERAITMYSKAKQYALEQNLEEEYLNLQKASTKLQLTHLTSQAQTAGNKGNMDQAVTLYNEARHFASSHNYSKEAAEIKNKSIKMQLESTLPSAQKGFAEKDWKKAAAQYRKLLSLMEKEKKNLNKYYLDSFSGVKKYLFLSQVANIKQKADRAELEQQYAKALSLYKKIPALLSASDAEKTHAISAIESTAFSKIRSLEIEVIIQEKTSWLTDNFIVIFERHYPPARESKLSDPKATFIRHAGESMIFSLSCMENNSGRTTRLKVFYQYDRKLNDWKIHSQPQLNY